jgi:hypothetical protein
VFDRIHRYKMERSIPTWEQALESLLPVEGNKPDDGKNEVEVRTLSESVY